MVDIEPYHDQVLALFSGDGAQPRTANEAGQGTNGEENEPLFTGKNPLTDVYILICYLIICIRFEFHPAYPLYSPTNMQQTIEAHSCPLRLSILI